MSKFEIYKAANDEFRFRLKSGNGQIVLSSEGYKQKTSCENGIQSVQSNCNEESCFERKESSNGKPFFNLKAKNGQVIGNSQMYSSAEAMETGIKSVMSIAKEATIQDLSAES